MSDPRRGQSAEDSQGKLGAQSHDHRRAITAAPATARTTKELARNAPRKTPNARAKISRNAAPAPSHGESALFQWTTLKPRTSKNTASCPERPSGFSVSARSDDSALSP
jgi:hypothetical protein